MKNNIFDDSTENQVQIAGGKVKHKTGGPEMVLNGFICPNGYNEFSIFKEELTTLQQQLIAPKICKNKDNKFGFYPSIGDVKFYGTAYSNYGKNYFWSEVGKFSDSFKCLCSFYSAKLEKVVYKLFDPIELEFVNEN